MVSTNTSITIIGSSVGENRPSLEQNLLEHQEISNVDTPFKNFIFTPVLMLELCQKVRRHSNYQKITSQLSMLQQLASDRKDRMLVVYDADHHER